jgi:hypothetical protein
VDALDRWLDVSVRIAKKFGMPKWALVMLKPTDGDYDVQTPQGRIEVYSFDWK